MMPVYSLRKEEDGSESLLADGEAVSQVPVSHLVELPFPVELTMQVGDAGKFRAVFEPGPQFGCLLIDAGEMRSVLVIGRAPGAEMGDAMAVVTYKREDVTEDPERG